MLILLIHTQFILFFQQTVAVNLDLSHWCSVKSHIRDSGFQPVNEGEATHDWEFRIKDSNNGDMRHYIEKIVIKLHETFAEPVKGNYKDLPSKALERLIGRIY